MPRFVVCVPAEGAPSAAPCADVGGVPHQAVVMELAAPGDVQFSNGGQLFAYGFTAMIVFWLIGLSIGAVLSVIRGDR